MTSGGKRKMSRRYKLRSRRDWHPFCAASVGEDQSQVLFFFFD